MLPRFSPQRSGAWLRFRTHGPRAVPAQPADTPLSVSTFTSGEVEAVLSGIPLEDLDSAQLSEALAQLPGLSTLPSSSLKQSLTKAIEQLAGKGAVLGQLGNGELVTALATQLGKLLSIEQLLNLLKGQSLSTVLTDGLGSLPASEVVEDLLDSSAHPEQLIGQLLGSLEPTTLEGLLGSTLTGQPFSHTTVGALAAQLGTTAEGLVSSLGTTTSQLPATATALTAPLTNGKLLGILDGLGGVTVSLLNPPKEEAPAEGKPGGGSGGSGGNGGSGGSGSSGGSGGSPGSSGSSTITPASTTVVLNSVPTDSQATGASSSGSRASLRIIGVHVRGKAITLVLAVSGPGTVALAGRGVRALRTQTSRAERVTLHTRLTRAGAASVRRRHGRVQLRLSFQATTGSSATATRTVVFR